MDGLASDGDGLASGDFFPQTISMEIEQPRYEIEHPSSNVTM